MSDSYNYDRPTVPWRAIALRTAQAESLRPAVIGLFQLYTYDIGKRAVSTADAKPHHQLAITRRVGRSVLSENRCGLAALIRSTSSKTARR